MTTYTDKKWVLLPPGSGVDNNWHITDDADTCVLHAYGFNHAVDDDSKALAKRAHACLTACAGIPTPRLEAGDTGILAHSIELKKMNDELLGLLEEARHSVDFHAEELGSSKLECLLARIDYALTKAKEGAV